LCVQFGAVIAYRDGSLPERFFVRRFGYT